MQKAKLKLNDQTYVRMHKASSGNTVVEHSTTDPEIKVLKPAVSQHQEKNYISKCQFNLYIHFKTLGYLLIYNDCKMNERHFFNTVASDRLREE